MRFAMYKNVNGGSSMIGLDNAYVEIRELGHNFAIALAERGHDTEESDLMNGLAAYHILKLEGESARLDAAHRMVIREITDLMFERAVDQARKEASR
jgi:hypothetical protein